MASTVRYFGYQNKTWQVIDSVWQNTLTYVANKLPPPPLGLSAFQSLEYQLKWESRKKTFPEKADWLVQGKPEA